MKQVEIFIQNAVHLTVNTNLGFLKTRHDDPNWDLTVRDSFVQISGTQHFLCRLLLNPELQTANAAKGKADASRNEDTTFETRNEASILTTNLGVSNFEPHKIGKFLSFDFNIHKPSKKH